MNRIVYILADLFPQLGRYKRFVVAWIDHIKGEKESYSQFGEDQFIIGQIKELSSEHGIYIDIGANHPTRISNTYKLYRSGKRGITIEPNVELINLHKRFRSEDTHLAVGCGEEDMVKEFYYSKTPVLSSFVRNEVFNQSHAEYLPVYTLDTIMSNVSSDSIDLISIDVEGWDLEVLKGSIKCLQRTSLVCVEANNKEYAEKIISFLSQYQFELIKIIECNYIFKSQKLTYTNTST